MLDYDLTIRGFEAPDKLASGRSARVRIGSTKVIVPSGHVAFFVCNYLSGPLLAPGCHTVSKKHLPLTAQYEGSKGLARHQESDRNKVVVINPLKPRYVSKGLSGLNLELYCNTELYFVSTKSAEPAWMTQQPIVIGNPHTGVTLLEAFGSFSFRVSNPQLFVRRGAYDCRDLYTQLHGELITILRDLLVELSDRGMSVLDMCKHCTKIGAGVHAKALAQFKRIGIALERFSVESIMPAENSTGLLQSMGLVQRLDDASDSEIKDGRLPVIKILFLAANPVDVPRLRLDAEARAIDRALRRAEFRDRFDIRQHWAVRATDLQECLLRHKPDVVHFSGHGSATSEIVLEDNLGNRHPVSVRALSRLFSVLKDNVRCVVLNACYSEPQARAIAEEIDCVVGMSGSIGDSAAISFSAAFYQALGFGRNLKTAFDLGCLQVDLENLDEQDVPKLLALRCSPETVVLVSGASP